MYLDEIESGQTIPLPHSPEVDDQGGQRTESDEVQKDPPQPREVKNQCDGSERLVGDPSVPSPSSCRGLRSSRLSRSWRHSDQTTPDP